FFRHLIFLSSPIEDLPFDEHTDVRKVLRDAAVEISQCHISESEGNIGNVFGLYDPAIYFRFLYPQSRLSHFGTLIQRARAGRGEFKVIVRLGGDGAYTEIRFHVAAKKVVELFFFGRELVRKVEGMILGLRQACFHLEAIGFQDNLLCNVVSGHTIQLAVKPYSFKHAFERALRLEDRVVGSLDAINYGLSDVAKLLIGYIACQLAVLNGQSDAVLLRQGLSYQRGEDGCRSPRNSEGSKRVDAGEKVGCDRFQVDLMLNHLD